MVTNACYKLATFAGYKDVTKIVTNQETMLVTKQVTAGNST